MLRKIVKKIGLFLFYKRNKVLREVFHKLKGLSELNKTSFKYTLNKTIESYHASLWYKKNFKLSDIRKLKYNSSKTLFLLGSGPSINELKSEHWELIKENDSWGFNLWHIHDFVPNVYFGQVGALSLQSQVMENAMLKKQDIYKNATIILRGAVFNKLKFHESSFGRLLLQNFNNVIPLPEYVIHSNCNIQPETYLNILHDTGFFRYENFDYPIPKFGATIGLLLSLAIKLGYKKIVLCGVDMLNNDHFYHDEKYSANDEDIHELTKRDSSLINANSDRTKRAFTDFDYILAFKKYLNEKSNGEIYLSTQNSLLYPHLEIYPDFIK
ncbi:MAG: hypothetical protein ACXWEY_00620 [Bacteroidia bacterium]